VPTLAAVTGFQTRRFTQPKEEQRSLTSLLGSLPTVNGNASLRPPTPCIYNSLRDPLCHPLVHTRTVLCMVGYLLPSLTLTTLSLLVPQCCNGGFIPIVCRTRR